MDPAGQRGVLTCPPARVLTDPEPTGPAPPGAEVAVKAFFPWQAGTKSRGALGALCSQRGTQTLTRDCRWSMIRGTWTCVTASGPQTPGARCQVASGVSL